MSIIKFKLQEVPHPKGEEAKHYYPVVANEDKLTAEEFCEQIHQRCTLTKSDIWAVMKGAAQILTEHLSNGMRVELPELGTFAASIVSDEPITDVDDKLIARHLRIDNIDFTPRMALMKELHRVNFHRTDQVVKHRAVLTDQQLIESVKSLCAESPTHSFDCMDFQSKIGVRRTKACALLSELTERGVLQKYGKWNSPYYTMA